MTTQRGQYAGIISKACLDASLNPELFTAIIEVESSFNTYAIRFEPFFGYYSNVAHCAALNHTTEETEKMLQKFSWGLAQIMGGTVRDLGYTGVLPALLQPEIGLHWGAQYLKKVCARYGNLDDQIAAYNAGSARKATNGLYVNQEYVEKVHKALAVG